MDITKIETPIPNDPYAGFHPEKAILVIVLFVFVLWGIWFAFSKTHMVPGNAGKIGLATSSAPIVDLGDSFYKNYVKITQYTDAKESYPEKEYLVITVTQQNLSGIDITNWKLRNSRGEVALIGKGTTLPATGKVNPVAPIKINGGDILTVSSGRSPIGVSFLMNSCALYLEQFQDFIPPIKDLCPDATNEKSFFSLDGTCQVFINQLPKCEMNTKALPAEITSSCKSFMNAHVSYNGCVSSHKNDNNFNTNEWKIFLGRSSEMWAQPNDTITLLDADGKTIDQVKY
jgi:hypothetical protein